MKQYRLFLIFIVFFTSAALPGSARPKGHNLFANNEKDLMGSGITINDTSARTCRNLDLLCRVWGFVKYYHPAMETGRFDMDRELFSVMPRVLQAKDDKQRNEVLTEWVLKFGPIGKTVDLKTLKDSVKYSILPDNDWIRNENTLGEKLSGLLQKIERAQRKGVSEYINKDQWGYTSFQGEKIYDSIPFSDDGFRMLTLFRFWNAMKYYFPYVHLTDRNWDEVLTYFIPKFSNYQSDETYYFLLREMVASLCDSHASFVEANEYTRFLFKNGFYKSLWFPVKTLYIDKGLVISDILDTTALTAGFQVGDIIRSVDDVTLTNYFNKLGKYTAHSRTSYLGSYGAWYLGSNNKVSRVELEREGKLLTLTFENSNLKRLYNQFEPVIKSMAQNGYAFINDSIGYIYPGIINSRQFDTAMIQFKNTKGIIMDMRSYPSEIFWPDFAPYFITDTVCAVICQIPDFSFPGSFINEKVCYNGKETPQTYKGKIIILTDHTTISKAEYCTMWLQCAPNATTVGNHTAGTDGNITFISLPYKDLGFQISILGVLYPDGTPTQRIGVKIDKIVNPTPQGIREGRDEILEKAIRVLQNPSR